LALGAVPVAAQKAQRLPEFGVETQLVAVPVFVTDKNGKAVPGLTAADFAVEDGGKSASVVAFQAVDATASGEAPEEASPRSPLVQAASRRQFLLLFDFAFSTPNGINKARAAAFEFLANGLGPHDLAAVAVLGMSGPSVLVGFTTDTAQLRAAVAKLGLTGGERLRDPLGLAWDLGMPVQETQSSMEFIETTKFDSDNRESFLLLQRTENEAYRRRVAGYVGNLDTLAKLLDSVNGRKQVVLFSAGFDQSLVSGAQGAERQASSAAVTEGRLWEVSGDSYFGDASARGFLDELFRDLGAADVVMHTVDIGGLAAGADVADATRTQIGRGRDTLAQLASGSGGMFLKEVNDVGAALRDVMDASRYFYVLGFTPVAEGKPGRFRKVSVKVKRSGLKASHRPGYLVRDPKAAGDASVARLAAGDAIAKGLSGGAFGLEALAMPSRSASGAAVLPVALKVDGPGLLAATKDKTIGLEVYGYALDASGRIYDAVSVTPSIDVDKLGAVLKDNGLQVLTVFRAPQGPADLRFLVRHPASGRAASLRVLAGEETTKPWPISPPLVMTDPGARLVMPVASRANPELDLPFRVGQKPFSPEVEPVLENGYRSDVCVIARPLRGPSLEVMADLRAADGRTTPLETSGPVRLVKDPDGAFRIVLSVAPSAVPAGSYALRVTLRDEAGEEAVSESTVTVK
jgi:VWFA-related protein